MSDAIRFMEKAAYITASPSGIAEGSVAMLYENGILVSREGIPTCSHYPQDFVYVERFSMREWAAWYKGICGSELSHDVPLHWAILVKMARRNPSERQPWAVLHGHSLRTPEDAARLGAPVLLEGGKRGTMRETEQFEAFLRDKPYPEHKAWLISGHGFFVAEGCVQSAIEELKRMSKSSRC